ncbi:MAG: right-handed parallel beta-helix repeat-containing protein [Anaerolineales bacterium]|nr:right-handed parallel beta-helix repeat-containing protein [Anaerolineales bacterium]
MRKQLVFFVLLSFMAISCAVGGVAATQASAPLATSPIPAITPIAQPATGEQPESTAGNAYYVSPAGDDDTPGSLEQPWATIQHAVDSVAPGDTILLLDGVYPGAHISTSGVEGAWITLKAAPGAQATLNTPGPENWHQSILELENGDQAVAYWLIEGLEIAGGPRWGIDVRGTDTVKNHHIIIRGNTVHDNGWDNDDTGIFAAFTDDVLIEGNTSYHNGEHGIYVNNSSDRFTVRNNVIYDNLFCGVHLNGDAEMGGDGIMSEGLVDGNIIFNNGSGGGAAINMDGVVNSVVQNNLLYANHASGIAIFQENGAVCSRDNRFLHNTLVMAEDARWAVIITYPQCTGNQLFSNIFYSYHAYRGSINLAGGIPEDFTSDYNILIDRFTTDDGESILDLAGWQALGYDAHSFIAEAENLFVDPGKYDFHLRQGSPAIDAGSPQGVMVDLEGNTRPAGEGFDCGAYEYGGSPPTPPLLFYSPLVVKNFD